MKRMTTLALVFLTLLTACGKQGDPPDVSRYTLEPQTIYQLEDATLHWKVAGATRVVIEASHGNAAGAVDSEDKLTVSPRETTTYTLRASNAFGTTSKALTLTVHPYGHPQVKMMNNGVPVATTAVMAGKAYDLIFSIPVSPPAALRSMPFA